MIALLAAGCGRNAAEPTKADPPTARYSNVIFIVVDALRADHLGVYGYERDTTPHLDRVASRGLVFDRAYTAASWTLPSLASYMTSVYPQVHGVRRPPIHPDFLALPEEFLTLAENLNQHGFHTASITSQPWMSDLMGLTQGFDETHTVSHASAPGEARVLVDELIGWLKGRRPSPFFLYAHFMGPHSPYDVPSRFTGRYTGNLPVTDTVARFHHLYEFESEADAYHEITRRARQGGLDAADVEYLEAEYDEKLAFTDEQLGVLFRYLEKTGVLDDSILIITADHGEAFYEHGTIFHGQHLHEELVRVPLVVRLPGTARPAAWIDEIVELIDLYPTIHELLGLPVPPYILGSSLVPVIRGGPSDGVAFCEGYGFKVVTRDWSSFYDYKESLHLRSGFRVQALYGLQRDRLEKEDLAGSVTGAAGRHRELAYRLWGRMAEISSHHSFRNEHVELDAETIENLESLGYLGGG